MYTKEALLGWVVLFKTGLFWRMCVHLAHVVLVPMWPIAICLSEEDAIESAPMRRLMNGFNTVSSQSHCCIFAINSSDSCGTFQHLEILKFSWQKKKIIKSTFVFETNFNDMYDCSAIQSVRYSVKVLFCMQHARGRGVNIVRVKGGFY